MTPLAAYALLFVAVGVGFIFVHLMAGKLIRPSKPGAEKGTIYECGEPTIGSAWIQFDLRFYVIALLFVIFDVEVAFFFPWAVVFGKANDLANTPPPSGGEASYQAFADKALELNPHAGPGAVGKSVRWSKAEIGEIVRKGRAVEANHLDWPDALKLPFAEEQEQLADMSAKEQEDWASARKEWLDSLSATERADWLRYRSLEKDAENVRSQARKLGWLAFGEVMVFFGVLLVGFAYLWKRGDLVWVRSLAAEEGGPSVVAPPPPSARPEPGAPTMELETAGAGKA
jgi:NADH:ubiquinone oxidoreductase subunit 3 (subunit A)